jgi:hypothetical protein
MMATTAAMSLTPDALVVLHQGAVLAGHPPEAVVGVHRVVAVAWQVACRVIAPAGHLFGGVVVVARGRHAIHADRLAVADAVVAVGEIVAHIGGVVGLQMGHAADHIHRTVICLARLARPRVADWHIDALVARS